jgi:hypothetical protein
MFTLAYDTPYTADLLYLESTSLLHTQSCCSHEPVKQRALTFWRGSTTYTEGSSGFEGFNSAFHLLSCIGHSTHRASIAHPNRSGSHTFLSTAVAFDLPCIVLFQSFPLSRKIRAYVASSKIFGPCLLLDSKYVTHTFESHIISAESGLDSEARFDERLYETKETRQPESTTSINPSVRIPLLVPQIAPQGIVYLSTPI